MALLFLDETGDHGLNNIDPNFPLFLLCGCLFEEADLDEFQKRMNAIKTKYWGTEDVIFHSRDIRKCEGPFTNLFDLTIKESFFNELNEVMDSSKFIIITAAINKEEHLKKYAGQAQDPYDVSLSFIMERLVYYTDDFQAPPIAHLVFEKRGKKEDSGLLAHFNSIRDKGTFYVNADRMKKRISGCEFLTKAQNIIGLQCADLCAYPLARSLILKGQPSKAAEILQKKIYNKGGKVYGMKVFP